MSLPCLGKVRYASRSQAKRALKILAKNKRPFGIDPDNRVRAVAVDRRKLVRNRGTSIAGLEAYECRHCGTWHLGHRRVGT